MGVERSLNLPGQPFAPLPRDFQRSLAIAILILLSAAVLMVVGRRLAGALVDPLGPGILLLVGVVVASVAAGIRLSWRRRLAESPRRWPDWAILATTSLVVVALAIGLCLPGTSPLGMFFLCLLLGVEESWAWGRHIRQESVFEDVRPPVATRKSAISLPETESLPEDVTQQLTRSRAADGTDELSGWLRLAFAAGQRTGSLHVAFCPPFHGRPALEVEQFDGPEARIKTAQLLSYGVRLDLKLLAAAEEPTGVLLQFSARHPA
jgi:hypothetical protein